MRGGPFAGTWKMNPAKTKFKTGAAPKEQTVTIAESGSDLNVKVAGIAADGSKIAYGYTIPSAGGTGKMAEPSTYEGISGKRMGPNEREVTYMKGGKTVYTTHSKVAADGNSCPLQSQGAECGRSDDRRQCPLRQAEIKQRKAIEQGRSGSDEASRLAEPRDFSRAVQSMEATRDEAASSEGNLHGPTDQFHQAGARFRPLPALSIYGRGWLSPCLSRRHAIS